MKELDGFFLRDRIFLLFYLVFHFYQRILATLERFSFFFSLAFFSPRQIVLHSVIMARLCNYAIGASTENTRKILAFTLEFVIDLTLFITRFFHFFHAMKEFLVERIAHSVVVKFYYIFDDFSVTVAMTGYNSLLTADSVRASRVKF